MELKVFFFFCLLTGKIAASSGHAAWISSKLSRTRVFELRGQSDAVIVGGNTVRQDGKLCTSNLASLLMPTTYRTNM